MTIGGSGGPGDVVDLPCCCCLGAELGACTVAGDGTYGG